MSLRDFVLAAVSGFACALSFPDFDIWPLAWIGLAPFLAIIRNKSVLGATALGVVMGFVYFSVTLYWVSYTMIDYADIPVWLAVVINGAMTLTLALYIGLFANAIGWISRGISKDAALAAAPIVWVAVEFFRSNFAFLAFPWARIADSQYDAQPIIQMADLAGEYGLGFLIILSNAALVKLIDWLMTRREPSSRFPVRWAAVSLGLILAAYGYGQWRLAGAPGAGVGEKRVALIQGDIDQQRKWDPSYTDTQVGIYTKRSYLAAANGAELIVWPETAAPFYFSKDSRRDPLIFNLSKTTGVPIIFGAPDYAKKPGGYTSYNRAWLVRPDGLAQKYDKMRLVPFGEYVPLRHLLFFVEKMVTAIGNMAAGERMTLLNVDDYMAGVQICFEIIFPEYSRQIATMGGGVIINITNDSWYGKTPASKQSLAMGVFRAVENRLPVLRAAQSGISAIITPEGKITGTTGLFVEATLEGGFTPRPGPHTLYTRTGDVFAWLCAGLAVILYVAARRRSRALEPR